jgi:inosine/xanthosine triphosphatase
MVALERSLNTLFLYNIGMKVVVGSTNPVKINAVKSVFEDYFPDADVSYRDVASGVASQPMDEVETRKGAYNRAIAACQDNEYGVGLEGGVCYVEGMMYECAWACIVDKSGITGYGGGLYFELPHTVADRIQKGEELGPIMAELMKYDVKRTDGAIGVLSKGKLKRQQAYEHLVKQALLKFVSPEWFE